MLVRALVLAQPGGHLRRISTPLHEASVLATPVATPEQLWEQLGHGSFDLVLLRRSELVGDPVDIVEEIRAFPDRPDVIVFSDREDPEERAALLASGCLAVVYEALPEATLATTLTALIQRHREEVVRRLAGGPPGSEFRLRHLVSKSPTMRSFLATAQRVVRTDSTLLLLGETGVGKEWLARTIHAEGRRATGPFIAVSCSALPETLLEGELFGHEKGAFTGATRSRRGYFEVAHRGTIFLDEIAELPAHLQVKLLRVLEERKIQPLGSERLLEVDVRVVAATNRDLEEEMREKRFRPDLFYRLNVVSLTLPPLRQRREDIPDLVRSYIEHFRVRMRREVVDMEPEALRSMVDYAWPGNVRELINVIERAVLMAPTSRIALADLPESVQTSPGTTAGPAAPLGPAEWLDRPWRLARRHILHESERRYLVHLLEATQGRVGEAARRAGLDPRSLFDKMRAHGLRKEEFRASPHPSALGPAAAGSGASDSDARTPAPQPRIPGGCPPPAR